MRVAGVALLSALLTAVPWAGANCQEDVSESLERLRALRQEIETQRQRAEDLGGREKGVLSQIQHLEETLSLTNRILRELEQQEAVVAGDLALTEVSLADSQQRLEVRQAELSRAVRQMYKHGRYHSLEILFSSRSFPNLLERFRFLGSVAGRNRQLLREVEAEEVQYNRAREALLETHRDLEIVKEQRGSEQKRIEADVGRRTAILDGIRNEKSQYEQVVRNLEASALELEDLIARMEADRSREPAPGGGDFEGRRGHLAPPVDGEVVVTFGKHTHPKFGTVTFSNGVDFRAAQGAPVRSVAPGTVEHVSWLTGYGQCVILSHGNGYYTLYAHLSEAKVNVGEVVREGTRLGSVGDTGSLIGPALHFEIRRGRDALDPAGWLRAR